MFGFGAKKAKMSPKLEPLEEPKHRTLYVANGNSLGLAGRPAWPPIIREDSAHRTELFQKIAEGLNALPRHNSMLEQLRKIQNENAVTVKSAVLRILEVMDQDDQETAKVLAEHERVHGRC